MDFTSEQRLDDGVLERHFTLGDVPGILWTPGTIPGTTPGTIPGTTPGTIPGTTPGTIPGTTPGRTTDMTPATAPAPLILLGHPGGLGRMYPRLAARARHSAARGFAAVTIELPGSGDRPPLPGVDQARAELRRAVQAGEPVGDDIVDRLILPLVEQSVPEWRAVLDALGIDGPAGYAGGVIAIGTRLAAVEPRIAAATLFAGSFVPRATFEEARQVTIPLLVLLQWDDEGNDRQMALDLFDAFGSQEKTLHANMGGHTGVPQFEGDEGNRFFERHLRNRS
jgi:pimeloyl-ACP methyl ester carboxylesterase